MSGGSGCLSDWQVVESESGDCVGQMVVIGRRGSHVREASSIVEEC